MKKPATEPAHFTLELVSLCESLVTGIEVLSDPIEGFLNASEFRLGSFVPFDKLRGGAGGAIKYRPNGLSAAFREQRSSQPS